MTAILSTSTISPQFPEPQRVIIEGQREDYGFAQKSTVLPSIQGVFFREFEKSAWVASTMQDMNLSSKKNNSWKILKVTLSMDQTDYYVALQKRIAELIPREAHRPTIDLKLVGENVSSREQKGQKVVSIGILGGLGPLADADLIERVQGQAKKLRFKQNNMIINLFSAPPPRRIGQILNYLLLYLYRIFFRFLRRKHSHFYLASNTAHTRIKLLRFFGTRKVVSLVKKVGDSIQKKNSGETIFIFGTRHGTKKGLYQRILKARGLLYQKADITEQRNLQQLINEIKQKPSREMSRKLEDYIIEVMQKKKAPGKSYQVLLGCTELSLALGDTGIARLKERLGMDVFNTQEIFSQAIQKELILSYKF